MARAAFCIASTVKQASQIVGDLRREGFEDDAISVLYSDKATSRDFAHTNSTKAPEGGVLGAAVGALLGIFLGWMIGTGALAFPGGGPFIAAGPVLAALGMLGVGAVAGGVVGALVGYGIPEFEAKRFEGKVVGGGILVSVHVDGRGARRRAYDVFAKRGAEDIAVADEARADFPAFAARRA
jgi:hypothetical protein